MLHNGTANKRFSAVVRQTERGGSLNGGLTDSQDILQSQVTPLRTIVAGALECLPLRRPAHRMLGHSPPLPPHEE